MALRDCYEPADHFPDRFLYALRHHGPTPTSVRLAGPNRGKKLGRKATHVRHLLRELAVFADWEDGTCWPLEETLMRGLGVGNIATVSRTVSDAKAMGWLVVQKRPPTKRSGRDWARNVYRLVIPDDVSEQLAEDARVKSAHPETSGQGGSGPDPSDGDVKTPRAQTDGDVVFPRGDGVFPRGDGESTVGDVSIRHVEPSRELPIEPSIEPPPSRARAWPCPGQSVR